MPHVLRHPQSHPLLSHPRTDRPIRHRHHSRRAYHRHLHPRYSFYYHHPEEYHHTDHRLGAQRTHCEAHPSRSINLRDHSLSTHLSPDHCCNHPTRSSGDRPHLLFHLNQSECHRNDHKQNNPRQHQQQTNSHHQGYSQTQYVHTSRPLIVRPSLLNDTQTVPQVQ